jgi:putative membrane protein
MYKLHLKEFPGVGYLSIAALLALAITACSTSRQQPEAAATPASTPAAQATQTASKARPAHHASASAASGHSSSAAIIARLHEENQKEIALGKLAAEKASSDEVRSYANQLVMDHTSADGLVAATAQKMNLHLRDSGRTSTARSKLSSAAGAEFDREFLQQTSIEHDKLIKALKQEREDAGDDNVEALIDQILPIFEQDQQLARILIRKEQA